MLTRLLNWLGREIVYVCKWGTYSHRYNSLDAAMGRPVHPEMSVAPPWVKMRIRKKRQCGGVMTAALGSIHDKVLLECRHCGATRMVDGGDYALGLYDSTRCDEPAPEQERPPQ